MNENSKSHTNNKIRKTNKTNERMDVERNFLISAMLFSDFHYIFRFVEFNGKTKENIEK